MRRAAPRQPFSLRYTIVVDEGSGLSVSLGRRASTEEGLDSESRGCVIVGQHALLPSADPVMVPVDIEVGRHNSDEIHVPSDLLRIVDLESPWDLVKDLPVVDAGQIELHDQSAFRSRQDIPQIDRAELARRRYVAAPISEVRFGTPGNRHTLFIDDAAYWPYRLVSTDPRVDELSVISVNGPDDVLLTSRRSSSPSKIVIVVDGSGSMDETDSTDERRLDEARRVVTRLIGGRSRSSIRDGALVVFGATVMRLYPRGRELLGSIATRSSRERMMEAAGHLRSGLLKRAQLPRDMTDLPAALAFAGYLLVEDGLDQGAGAILVIADGETDPILEKIGATRDQEESDASHEVSRFLHDHYGIRVSAVCVHAGDAGDGADEDLAERRSRMQRLAAVGGGRLFEADQINELRAFLSGARVET